MFILEMHLVDDKFFVIYGIVDRSVADHMASMLNQVAVALIQALHVLLILFMVIAPFTNSPPLLVLHFIASIFLWIHWASGIDACFLTLVERKLRGVEDDKSFFYNLVSPVYKLSIDDKTMRQLVMVSSVGLWLVTANKLWHHPEYWRLALLPQPASK